MDPCSSNPHLPRAAAKPGTDGQQEFLSLIRQRSLPGVELSNVSGSSRQFDRNSSFGYTSMQHSADWDIDSSDSDLQDSSQQEESTPKSWATGGFEPFEVEEQATEVKYLKSAYSKKERECEHLRQIIKELSQSRSKAHKTKVELEEQFAGLQKEYYSTMFDGGSV
eukprot:GHRR01012405.1.p1 GENE.GHRR01012405.1~~GHRR01012405.1.p1  ORF type:complete len:166 (+),score=44.58 GHRR01012405.1:340-837(+)